MALSLNAACPDQDVVIGVQLSVEGAIDGGADAGTPETPVIVGCADATREGFVDRQQFPDLAACGGTWAGWIDEPDAGALCAAGWRVCRGAADATKLATVTHQQATAFFGCFAFDAANDCYGCHPSCRGAIDTTTTVNGQECMIPDGATQPDMAGVGANCTHHSVLPMTSCLKSGRLDSSTNTWGCQYNPSMTGVLCCRTP